MGKTIRRKFMSVILTLAMVVSLLPALTLPASATITDGVYTWPTGIEEWTLEAYATYNDADNGLTITYTDTGECCILTSNNGWLQPQGDGNITCTLEKTSGTFSPDPTFVKVRVTSGGGSVTISGYKSDGGLIASQAFTVNKTGTVIDLTSVNSTALTNVKKIKFASSSPFDITELTLSSSNIAPNVTTQAVGDITSTTATGNGNITALGTPNPTQHGFVWSTSADPTTSDSKTEQGAASATGAFTGSITGLTAGTTYYVRAYATNDADTSYGTQVSFTTAAAASNTVYVDSNTGSDTTGDGTSSKPYKTFTKGYSETADGGTLDLTGIFTWTDADETGDAGMAGFTIDKNITIQGHGAGTTVIQAASSCGGSESRVFTVDSDITVTFDNLEIRYGYLARENEEIYKEFYGGGGLELSNGDITISNCYIHHNKAAKMGFGIDASNSSVTLNINDSVIAYNNSSSETAGSPRGGGIFTFGKTTITNSTISNNSGVNQGAGVYVEDTTIVMTNCTVTNNSSNQFGGGGLYIINSTVTITNCTIAYNSSTQYGGGFTFDAGTLNIKNTIIANNNGDSDCADFDYIKGTITDNGYNIVEHCSNSSLFTHLDDLLGEQESLGLSDTLADNGGGTQTLALQAGSIAIDAGDNGTNGSVPVPITDQRGFDRDTQVDIGAYEYIAASNEAPTDISLSSSSVAENTSSGTVVGTLSTTDADSGDTFTYTLVSGDGSTDNGSFTIDGSSLKLAVSPDYETKSSYSVRIQTKDAAGATYSEAFTITITDVNDAPTDIALSNSSVNEGTASGTAVGTLSATDADSGDTFTYTLVSGTGDTDNASFTIDGTLLKLGFVPDYDTKNSYSVRVKCTDGGGLTCEKAFTITITMVNVAPTDITLSSSSVDENTASGTAVGTLSTTDGNASDTFTYTLVSGAGDTDNASFTIDGSSLKLAVTPDYETKSSYSVRIQTEDAAGETYSKAFTITITDVNDAPTDIALSNSSVNEGTASGTAVGTLSATDADAGDSATFTLVDGDGADDNGSFSIDGTTLKLGFVPDYDTKNSYSVRVRCTDGGGLTYDEAFTIGITMVNEAPTDIALSGSSVAENTASDSTVGTLSTTDGNASDTFTYSLVSGTGDTDNGSFTIGGDDSNELKLNVTPDYETKSSYSVRIQTEDAAGATYSEAFTISITNVNEAPTDIALSNSSVAEGTASDTAVGTLSATDADADDSATFTLVDGDGADDNGSFSIDGTTLKLGFVPDYDTKNSYSVRVRCTDGGGLTYDEAFTIGITMVNEAPTDIALSGSSVAENTASDSTVGTLSTTDGNASDTFTYTLVSGDGSTDNGSFTIGGDDGDELKLSFSPDYETKSSYSVRIQTEDAAGETYSKAFTITITDVKEATAANSTVAASSSSVEANGTATSTITVTLKDTNGNPVSDKTVTLAQGTGSSTITTVSGTTNSSGEATFTVKSTKAEAVTYTATDSTDNVTVTQTAAVTFTAPTYTATINTKIDGTAADMTSVVLKSNSSTVAAVKDSTGVYTATVVNGTYNVYVNGIYTGDDITINYAAASATVNYYTVTFNTNGGGTVASQTILSGGKATVPTAPTKSGNTFGGWYTVPGCTDGNEWNFGTGTITAARILYAKWTPVLTYTVTYSGSDNTSGSVPVDNNSYASGANVTVKGNTGSLAKSGYTFAGWTYDGTTYTAGQTFEITGNVTLTAAWTPVASTYTATYSYNYDGGGTYTTRENIYSGSTLTAPATDPTRSGYTFIGWYKEAACVNPWNFSVDTITANTMLFAKWAENTYSVSGTVRDDGTPIANVSGATVRVTQGKVLFGETVTASDGTFTVTGVPDGTYNLVITKGNQKVTVCITIPAGSAVDTITLPKTGNRNSMLEVNGSGTPDVVVDNLNDVFGSGTNPNSVYRQEDINNVNNGGTVEIKLTVQKNDSSTDKTEVEATMTSGGYTTGMVLDVDMTKTVTTSSGASSSETITKLDDLITLIIPLPAELQGKTSYVVTRAHDYGSGIVVDTITTSSDITKERIVVSADKTQLTLYVKFFSTYAIGYTTTSGGVTGGGGSSSSYYSITTTAGTGGSISPTSTSVVRGGSKTFTITADEGYCISNVLVDGESVGAVGSYTFSNVSAAHTIKAVFTKETTGWTNPFDDVNESDWFYDAVKYVAETGLMNGTSGTSFGPNLSTTRGMIVTILWRLENKPEAVDSSSFSDVAVGEYYANAVAWAEANGIVLGYDADTYGSDDPITREQLAAILYRYAKYKGYDVTATNDLSAFTDSANISTYALPAIKWAVAEALVSGNPDATLSPNGKATRAQVAMILMRFIENAN